MMCSPLKGDIRFIFLKSHLENDSESPLILFYFFKRENKIRNKNPSVTLFVKKKSMKNCVKIQRSCYLLEMYNSKP